MSRRANPALIGAFLLGAMLLVVVGVFTFAGGGLLERRPEYVMYFEGSVYGLQIGAPVVFRGVRIGSVKSVSLRFDPESRNMLIPVIVETEPESGLADVNGGSLQERDVPDTGELIARGLRARLATQSLLTGQLYIELDFFPDKAAVYRSAPVNNREIPTIASSSQELASKLERIDLDRLVNSLYELAGSMKGFLGSGEMQRSMKNLDATLANLRSLTARLDGQVEPVVAQLSTTLNDAASAMQATQNAMQSVQRAAGGVEQFVRADSPLQTSLRQTSEEIARTASALRQLTDEQTPTLSNLNRTMKDLSSAARAMRELAESIERHPESLVKGRKHDAPNP